MRTQKTYSRENLRSQIGTTGALVGFDLGSQRWKAGQDLHQPNRLITPVSDRRSRVAPNKILNYMKSSTSETVRSDWTREKWKD